MLRTRKLHPPPFGPGRLSVRATMVQTRQSAADLADKLAARRAKRAELTRRRQALLLELERKAAEREAAAARCDELRLLVRRPVGRRGLAHP